MKPDQIEERITRRLLNEALEEGPKSIASMAHHPFYRLTAEERFILVALTYGKWTYERVARFLRESNETIAETAWAARLYLAAQNTLAPLSSRRGPSCPEWNPRRPWTQKFLDEEMTRQERIYLQSHVDSCESCRKGLSQSRSLFYNAQKLIPAAAQALTQALEKADREAELVLNPRRVTAWESLITFLQRGDVKVAIFLLAAVLVITLRR